MTNMFVCSQELKTQCFGGDYMGEVFDHMLKRCVKSLCTSSHVITWEVFDHMLKRCVKSLCTSSHVITWERCSITC